MDRDNYEVINYPEDDEYRVQKDIIRIISNKIIQVNVYSNKKYN